MHDEPDVGKGTRHYAASIGELESHGDISRTLVGNLAYCHKMSAHLIEASCNLVVAHLEIGRTHVVEHREMLLRDLSTELEVAALGDRSDDLSGFDIFALLDQNLLDETRERLRYGCATIVSAIAGTDGKKGRFIFHLGTLELFLRDDGVGNEA